jgi:phosphoribosyl-AMP cyclohydrolase
MNLFDALADQKAGDRIATAALLEHLCFNEQGLIPAIAQQQGTGEVLMMAWMNAASIATTLSTGQVCYWSRSRQQFWRKGESSGNTQKLITMHTDCDGDTLLLQVDQQGPACHTNRRSCFFIEIDQEQSHITANPQ